MLLLLIQFEFKLQPILVAPTGDHGDEITLTQRKKWQKQVIFSIVTKDRCNSELALNLTASLDPMQHMNPPIISFPQ